MTIADLEKKEERRQAESINLIASENYASAAVRRALSSVFTNKYAEGKPHTRYYMGNAVVDELEDAVKSEALKTFGLSDRKWGVNVQPYSGSIANIAVYFALVPAGEKIMAMDLNAGGHLTHGSKVSITGKFWKQVPYGVHPKTKMLDYDAIARIAKREKPKLIIAGGSAYSRHLDFKKFKSIARSVKAILMVDMSHFAGLVAGDVYPSPFPYADIITTTTHKTLRGPRAAMIFSRKSDSRQTNGSQLSLTESIDKAVFPGIQGGPHMNAIAAMGVALKEAQSKGFQKYARQTVKNARTLVKALQKYGWRIVSEGTDSHLFLMDTTARGVNGKESGELLEAVGIVANKNILPFDTRTPHDPSGVRIGTPAVTTRGMKEPEMKLIAGFIHLALSKTTPPEIIAAEVKKLAKKFPIPADF